MKKTSLLVVLPAVALGGLLLTGCGMFRSHKAWNTAQQEAPLEIPPSLDRPSTSAALVIPPKGANNPTANGATADVGDTQGQITDGFVAAENVDAAYTKVGQALKAAGQVTAHDDASHSYTVSVTGGESGQKKGFFHRMFGHSERRTADAPIDATNDVQVTVNASGANGSQVRAQGNPSAVVKVVNVLKSSMGS